VTGTRQMVSALQAVGGRPLYIEFATGGHGISAEAVNYPHNRAIPACWIGRNQQVTMDSSANANGIIYSNLFNGGAVTLNGRMPTSANSFLGGSSNATWICTYTNNVPTPRTARFWRMHHCHQRRLRAPAVYAAARLHLSHDGFANCAGGMANWVAMGFAQHATQVNDPAHARFTDDPIGYALINPQENHTWNFFAGPKATVSIGSAPSSLLPSEGTYRWR